MRNHPGYTLAELSIVLLLATMLLTAAAPSFRRGRDQLAVRAARSELLSVFAATRSTAIVHGGARVVIDAPAGIARMEATDGRRLGNERRLGLQYGITLELLRGSHAVLHYDGLGIGRMANASIRIRRGRAVASVTVSAYGRVRS